MTSVQRVVVGAVALAGLIVITMSVIPATSTLAPTAVFGEEFTKAVAKDAANVTNFEQLMRVSYVYHFPMLCAVLWVALTNKKNLIAAFAVAGTLSTAFDLTWANAIGSVQGADVNRAVISRIVLIGLFIVANLFGGSSSSKADHPANSNERRWFHLAGYLVIFIALAASYAGFGLLHELVGNVPVNVVAHKIASGAAFFVGVSNLAVAHAGGSHTAPFHVCNLTSAVLIGVLVIGAGHFNWVRLGVVVVFSLGSAYFLATGRARAKSE